MQVNVKKNLLNNNPNPLDVLSEHIFSLQNSIIDVPSTNSRKQTPFSKFQCYSLFSEQCLSHTMVDGTQNFTLLYEH